LSYGSKSDNKKQNINKSLANNMLDKTFSPQSIESDLYQQWEQSGLFACNPSSSKKPYTIMMPPPNVTGSLHVGHALTYTLQDVLIRFKRMCGYDVLWQPGTDHAGIATQMVVERQLEAKKISRHDLGREKFIEKVWEWKAESGNAIVMQQRRLGISPDWERQRFTLDEGLSKAVTKVFVELYRQGLIYRDKRLVNWDSKLQTAISDLEVVSEEVKGHLWYIQYPVVGQENSFITVATTRPETMLGDTAVAVHPEDERYHHLIGEQVYIPLTDRAIPIIADAYCDPEKGTGAVKITPGHDFNDFEVGKRHHLPMINILDSLARLNENAPERYRGLHVEEARKKVLQDLEEQGFLIKAEMITHAVPYGDRSGIQVQPWLTDQWFVDAYQLAQPAIKAVEEGKTKFVPEHWNATYFDWLKNIQPWCISRQIWWGHQVPAWYGPDQMIFVAETEEEALKFACEHYGKAVKLTRDMDVLDTWFSSALWPFSTLGWPEQTLELKRYYPTDVLDTGFDIIFFWVARMMMMGLHFMKDVPFRTVYIHALVRDEKGAKMSKSKGNIIDPLGLLDRYGCDAVRFTLASLAVPGRDLKLGESRIEGSRNFMTKIWNAARFLQMNQCSYVSNFDVKQAKLSVNRWIISEVAELADHVHQALEAYRFDEASQLLYQFVWGTYCDYYLEFLKPLFGETADVTAQQESRQTAAWAFVQILRLAHPIIPFITEKLWAEFVGKGLLCGAEWPQFDPACIDAVAQQEMQWLVELISQIRSRRAEFNISPGVSIPLQIFEVNQAVKERIEQYQAIIQRLGRVAEVSLSPEAPQAIKEAVQFVVGQNTVVIPLAGSIDIGSEVARLKKEIGKLDSEIVTSQTRLSNKDFTTKAKPEVVEELGERLAIALATKEKIEQALARLS
jgi:valyl-tRNA synthetase